VPKNRTSSSSLIDEHLPMTCGGERSQLEKVTFSFAGKCTVSVLLERP